MSDYKIVDKSKDAVWVLNQGEYRIPDYARHSDNPGTDLIMLEPGVPTKIKFSDALRANTTLVEIEDPTQSEGIVIKAPKAEKPAKAKEEADGKESA